MSLVNGITDITLDYDGLNVSLASVGAGLSWVSDGAGPVMSIKGLAAADTTASVSGSTTGVTLAATGSNVTLATTGAGVSLVSDDTGPDLALYGLTGGSNISATLTAGPAVTIAQTQLNKSYGAFSKGTTNQDIPTNLTWVTVASAGNYGTLLALDMSSYNLNYIRYTGATTKVFKVSTQFTARTTGSYHLIYMDIRVNGLTILPAQTFATIVAATAYNPLILSATITLAQNDYFEIIAMLDTALAYPRTIEFSRLGISIYEI